MRKKDELSLEMVNGSYKDGQERGRIDEENNHKSRLS
jgi:hypothetical protein